MHHPIHVGTVSVTFLKSRHETSGALDLFEVTVPPLGSIRVPHLHRQYDETVIGMNGIASWMVDGRELQVAAGQQLHVPRGSTHCYSNLHPTTCRMLCILTPGVVGPEYFREMAAVLRADGPPDMASLAAVMNRYGVIPSTA